MKFLMKSVQVLSVFLIGLSAVAGVTDGKIKTEVTDSKIVLVADKGFHFNDKGPASATFDDQKKRNNPTVKTEPKFEFDIPAGAQQVSLRYFVCDDAKTVCEQHTQQIDLKKKSN